MNKKDYVAAIIKFYSPEEELKFYQPPIDGGRYLRQWMMVVPQWHSKEKDVNVFSKPQDQRLAISCNPTCENFRD